MKKPTIQQSSSEVVLKDLFSEFIRFKNLQNLSPESIKYYEDCYRYFIESFDENNTCADVSEDIFYSYIEHIKKKNRIKVGNITLIFNRASDDFILWNEKRTHKQFSSSITQNGRGY